MPKIFYLSNNLFCDNNKSKMSDTCKCEDAEFNGSLNLDQNFAKKLLVAISIVILLSMCVMPAQARSLAEHKKRHNKQASTAATKDLMIMPNLKEKNSDLQLSAQAPNKYRRAVMYIFKQLKHSYRSYNSIRHNLSDYSIFNRGKPDWLPRTNYKMIHFKRFTDWEQKFKFVIPRIFRSLKMYELIFEALKGAEMTPVDVRTDLYRDYRQEFLQTTLILLRTTLMEIQERSRDLNVKVPVVKKSSIKTQSLLNVPYPQHLMRNDYIALRGYGKTINNWYCELHPGTPSRKTCQRYFNRITKSKPE